MHLPRQGDRKGSPLHFEKIRFCVSALDDRGAMIEWACFQRWLAGLRQTARPEEFEAITSGYRLEIERMQAEVLEYLLRPVAVEAELQRA